MKNVELAEVRAMLREIAATFGNDAGDVAAIMSLGTPDKRSVHMSAEELNQAVRTVHQAVPRMRAGMLALNNSDWQKIEKLYYRKVMQPIFS